MQSLTAKEIKVHERALALAKTHRAAEWAIIKVLQDVQRTKLYKKFNKPSLFLYARELLGLSPALSYSFSQLAKTAMEYESLNAALAAEDLTVSKAVRFLSTLDEHNAEHLIQFSIAHTVEQIDKECVRLKPRKAKRDRLKPQAENEYALTATLSERTAVNFRRAKAIAAQRGQSEEFDALFNATLEVYLDRFDPVRKAERAMKRRQAPVEPSTGPITAQQNHEVFARDQGRCTFVNEQGERCNTDRWVAVHHIKFRSRGGTNHPTNLTTLCSFHHDLVHQMSLPIEGQVTWLRSPAARYRLHS